MTPEYYIEQIRALIGAGQDQEALDFSARYSRDLHPGLSDAELDLVSGMLEGAAMAVSLERATTPQQASDPISSPSKAS
jgi:hypothetical protein